MSSSLNSTPSPTPPPSPPSYSYNTSLLVIAILLAFVVVFTILIHLILRLLARLSSTPTPALIHLNSTNSSILTSTSTNTTTATTSDLDPSRKSLIDSLPHYSLSSLALSASANCTICLSHFTSEDKLRLLPPCRHVFHSHCIDVWLKSSPSCPLCRSLVQVVHPDPPPPQPQQQEGSGTGTAMATTAEEVARVSWLKEYLERLAISASSSFNSMRYSTSPFGSMRFSTWGSNSSRRYDDGEVSGISLELGESFRSEESGYFASSYKWMMNLGAAP